MEGREQRSTSHTPFTNPSSSARRQLHREDSTARLNGFQPSSARLRQAAAQALARSNHSRTVNRVLSAVSQSNAPSGRGVTSGTTISGTVNPSIHPQFRSKAVCNLFCSHCSSNLCQRGMRAILLGNTSVELFSTDRSPFGVALVDKDYFTKNCSCRIRDAACLGCGNVVGYHVTHPCERCLEACNNGHFWMFLSDAVKPVERLERSGSKILRWSSIAEQDVGVEETLHAERESGGALCR